MKIIKNNKVLIQLMDLKEILNLEPELNEEIRKTFIKDIEGMTDVSQHSFIEYDNQDIVNYLEQQDWIIDYEVYLSLLSDDIRKITDKINMEKVHLINLLVEYEEEYEKPNSLKEEVSNKMENVYRERLKKEYMQDSIEYFLRIRFGQFDLDIKKGIIIK